MSRMGALCVRSPWLVAVVAIGCVGAPGASQAPVSTQPSSVPVPSIDATPTPIPSGPLRLIGCRDGQHCKVAPGSYFTGPAGFFPGLEITIPANWFLTEQDSGELSLHPNDHPGDALLLWKDVRVVATTRRSGPANEIVQEVARTPEAFVEWFTTSSDFTVIEDPTATTIAGTSGTFLAVEVSKSADYGDPGCPSNPRCADFVTDPAHWGPNFFAVGGDEAVRLYVATIRYGDFDHLFVVAWDTPSAAELQAFEGQVGDILDTIRLPAAFIKN